MDDPPLMEMRGDACEGGAGRGRSRLVEEGRGKRRRIPHYGANSLSPPVINPERHFSVFAAAVMLLAPLWLVKLGVDSVLR